jgi:transposase
VLRLPASGPVPPGKGGRPSRYCMRDVVDGIRYLTRNGPAWRALPAGFPPAWTACYRAAKWQAGGSAQAMHDQLRDRVRLLAGREAGPTAAITGSPSRSSKGPMTCTLSRYCPAGGS